MTLGITRLVVLCLLATLTSERGRQGVDDAELRAAVDRFFAMQQAEDVAGYLGLWSTTAKRPTAEQLKYVFDGGDDTFSDVAVFATFPSGNRVRVSVSATRERVTPPRVPGGSPFTSHAKTTWSLLYVRENSAWKLVREGPAVDGLADDLIEAATAEERDTLLQAEPAMVTSPLVIALSRRGGQFAQEQNYPRAQAAFELARDVAQRVGDRRLEGEALQNLANTMYFQRNMAGALASYEQRLTIEREREDREGIAASLLGVATVPYTFAEYATALTLYREALAIKEGLSDDGVVATTLISTGNILYLQGDFTAAIADYARSRDISRKASNTAGEADALEGLARVYVAQGDYGAALDALSSVLADGKARNDRNDQGTALLSIGDVHFRLGNLDNARAALVEGRTHYEAIKDKRRSGRTLQAIALVDLVAARFTLAEEEYRKAGEICTASGDAECVATAVAGLAFAQTAQEKFADGIASYTKAIAAFTSLRRSEPVARAEIGLSRALTGSGAFQPALDAARRARVQAEALQNDDVLWRACVVEATALRRMRDRPQALAAASAAITAVQRLLDVAGIRPSAPIARDTSAAFAMLALLQAEDGDAATAFETVERMRVHDLRVLLLPGERDIFRGMTDAERLDERTLAAELISVHAQLSRERGLPKPDAARIERLEKAVAEAAGKKTAQQQALYARLPSLATWRGSMAPATRAEVDTLLTDSSTLLLQFVVTDDNLLVLMARRGEDGVRYSSQFEPVSRRGLAERVGKLLQPETVRDAVLWRTAALELVPGLSAVFGSATKAIVVPHETLWHVPLEAFPIESGVVADRTSIVYAPSVTALVRTPAPVATASPSLLVSVAAPALAPTLVDEIARTAPGWTIRQGALAQAEVDAVMRGAAPDQILGLSAASATESAVVAGMAKASSIHIAAPFRVNGASPMFSTVLLAPESGSDGTLEAREIMNLELHAGVVVLSDGGTVAMRDAADEVGAVAWAWRAAGAPTLVLPRWASDNQSATQMMSILYERLRAGDSPEVALQAARTKIRDSRATSAPFFWAGWMLVGNR